MVKPCDYREARQVHSSLTKLYWVTIYLLIDEFGHVSDFLHESDFNDNLELALEVGVRLYTRKIECFCSPDFMRDLYRQICEYEKYVSRSNLD